MEEFVSRVSLSLSRAKFLSARLLRQSINTILLLSFWLLLGNVFNLLWWNAVQMRNCMCCWCCCCCLGCVCASFHVVCPARTEVGPVKRIMQRCRQSTAAAAASSRDEATKWVFVLYIDGSLLHSATCSAFIPVLSWHVLKSVLACLASPFIVYEKWVDGLFCCCRVHWM